MRMPPPTNARIDTKWLAEQALYYAELYALPAGVQDNSLVHFVELLYQANPMVFTRLQQLGLSSRCDMSLITSLFFWLRWLNCGLPVFRLTESVLAGLVLTDSADVKTEDWRPPFDAFLVEIPDGFWKISSEGAETPKGAESAVEGGFVRTIEVLCNYTTLNSDIQRVSGMYVKARTHRGLDIYSQGYLTATTLGGLEEDCRAGVRGVTEEETEILVAVLRIVFNLSMYIEAFGRGVRADRQSAKLRRGRKQRQLPQRSGRPVVWVIGKEVKFDSQTVAAAKSCISGGAGWKLNKRFTVRGHWRQQVCGVGRLERRRTWIKPHWKGPATAERIAHLYRERDRE